MLKKIQSTYRFWKANIRVQLLARISARGGVNKTVTRKRPIVITLTSYPKRFSFVHLTIVSLLHQTIKPDSIILWLSKEESSIDTLPKALLGLRKRGLTIKYVDGNLKSYKKLVYAVQEYPDALLITCDDDIIYENDVIESLILTHKEFPESIVANRCVRLEKLSKTSLKPYHTLKLATSYGPSFNLLPTGVGGVLYPPGFLHADVVKQELFVTLSPSADDVWFKAMGMLNNRKIVLAKRKMEPTQHIRDSQKDALWRINVATGENDRQIENVFSHYDLYKLIE